MPYATNDGVRVYYEIDGSGPPLVLHAGFSASLPDWRDFGFVDALRDEYRLILMDPRGHGQSDKPHDPAAYTFDRRVGDIVAVLDDLDVATAHFWGYSMGGHVGFAIAHFAPDRFRSLIVGGMHPYARDAQAFRERAAALRASGPTAIVAGWKGEGVAWPASVLSRILLNDVEALAASSIATGEAPDFGEHLREVHLPMLIYCGDRDASYTQAQAAVAEAPHATFVTLSGLNHGGGNLSLTVVPYVRTFLADVEQTRTDKA